MQEEVRGWECLVAGGLQLCCLQQVEAFSWCLSARSAPPWGASTAPVPVPSGTASRTEGLLQPMLELGAGFGAAIPSWELQGVSP